MQEAYFVQNKEKNFLRERIKKIKTSCGSHHDSWRENLSTIELTLTAYIETQVQWEAVVKTTRVESLRLRLSVQHLVSLDVCECVCPSTGRPAGETR